MNCQAPGLVESQTLHDVLLLFLPTPQKASVTGSQRQHSFRGREGQNNKQTTSKSISLPSLYKSKLLKKKTKSYPTQQFQYSQMFRLQISLDYTNTKYYLNYTLVPHQLDVGELVERKTVVSRSSLHSDQSWGRNQAAQTNQQVQPAISHSHHTHNHSRLHTGSVF